MGLQPNVLLKAQSSLNHLLNKLGHHFFVHRALHVVNFILIGPFSCEIDWRNSYKCRNFRLSSSRHRVSHFNKAMSVLGSQGQLSSLQRLQYVEKRIVRLIELAGVAMDELGNASAPKTEVLSAHCRDFMMAIKEIQTTLREEIKGTCEYRPFEKCDYNSRITNEICCKKLEHIIEQLDAMQQTVNQYSNPM